MFDAIVSFVIISQFLIIAFLYLAAFAALVNFIATIIMKIRRSGGKSDENTVNRH